MSQEIPTRIYLQWNEDGEPSRLPTWSVVRAHDTDILYTQGDPERLRLLEAVSKAMLAASVAYGLDGDGPATLLDEAMAEGADLLAQLGELYYSTGEGRIT